MPVKIHSCGTRGTVEAASKSVSSSLCGSGWVVEDRDFHWVRKENIM